MNKSDLSPAHLLSNTVKIYKNTTKWFKITCKYTVVDFHYWEENQIKLLIKNKPKFIPTRSKVTQTPHRSFHCNWKLKDLFHVELIRDALLFCNFVNKFSASLRERNITALRRGEIERNPPALLSLSLSVMLFHFPKTEAFSFSSSFMSLHLVDNHQCWLYLKTLLI